MRGLRQRRSLTLEITGHSIAHGGGTSKQNRRYTTLLAKRLRAREVNHSVSGAIACFNDTGREVGDGGWEHALRKLHRPADVSARLPGGLIGICHYGVNDLAVVGPQNLDPVKHAMRAVISRHRAASVFDDDCRTITIPGAFTGGVVALGFEATPGEGGLQTIEVDGAPAATLDTRGIAVYEKFRCGAVARVGPLAPGAHTITVDGADFRYWQIEQADPPLVLLPLGHGARSWHVYEGWPNKPVNEDVPFLNQALREVAAEFGDRVVCVDTESVLRLRAELMGENQYPNDAGHRALADAMYEALATRL